MGVFFHECDQGVWPWQRGRGMICYGDRVSVNRGKGTPVHETAPWRAFHLSCCQFSVVTNGPASIRRTYH